MLEAGRRRRRRRGGLEDEREDALAPPGIDLSVLVKQ
jgi:hypothetical protein